MSNTPHHHIEDLPPRGLDGLGVLLSGLCLVHCLATPLLASLLPFAAAWYTDEHDFHLWLAVILLPLGAVAFWRGYKRHSRLSIVIGGVTGLSLLLMGIVIHGRLGEHDSETSLISFTILGSLILVLSHWKNWQYSRCVACAETKIEIQLQVPGDRIACANGNDPEHQRSQV